VLQQLFKVKSVTEPFHSNRNGSGALLRGRAIGQAEIVAALDGPVGDR
jgi:hypothetical protein